MAEERVLTAVIRPKLDLSELQKVLSEGLSLNLNTGEGKNGGETDSNGNPKGRTVNLAPETVDAVEDAVKKGVENGLSSSTQVEENLSGGLGPDKEGGNGFTPKRLAARQGQNDPRGPPKGGFDDDDGNAQRNRTLQRIQAGLSVVTTMGSTLLGVGRSALGFLESITGHLKQSSPLLQAVESLFNLAIQMFLMPIGNKIGQELIPTTVELLDTVLDMWNAFDNMTIGEAVSFAITEGTKVFGDYLKDIGGLLEEEGGTVGAIGSFLVDMGEFIEDDGEKLLNAVLGFASFFMDNWEAFVTLYVSLQTAQIGATIGAAFGPVGAAVGMATGGLIGGVATASFLSGVEANGDGAYVPPTTGGQLRIVSERGEGEYIIPESKMDTMGSVHITNNFHGYTMDELIEKVTEVINDQVFRTRVSGGI